MQRFIVVASLVSELAGGQNDPPLVLNVTKDHLSALRVKKVSRKRCRSIFDWCLISEPNEMESRHKRGRF